MATKSNALLILQAYGQVKRLSTELATRCFKPVGLGPLQAGLVRRMGEQGTTSLAELARLMALDPAAVGRAVDTLIKKGWVQRIDHPSDRRRWQVSLTPKGLELLAEVQAEYRQIAQRFTAHLTPAEQATLLGLLTKIGSGLEQEAQRKGRP